MNTPELQRKTFLLMLIAVSLAFAWILLPFYGAVFWGSVLAIIFTPFYRKLLALTRRRPNLAALTTLLICLIAVILPVIVMTASMLQEGVAVYQRIRSGELNFGAYFQQVISGLPPWLVNLLDQSGLTNISELQEMLSTGVLEGSQFIAMHALSIGQNTFEFVISFGIMLYLLFFLLRDGAALSSKIKQSIPLSTEHKRHLFSKFTTVIRATVKGNVVVAAIQGALGGVIFSLLGIQGALLWGFVMAFLSLIPAVGAGLIWVPVAIYFLVTGATWQGIVLIAFGVFVIGLVDNLLRPVLVGRDTKIPDYVILISTLGGLVLFGLNGFVIGPVIAALFIAAWDLFSSSKEVSPPD
ncbi:AI-2E family transporter [Nitrosospira briensis]|uniref:Predicted PurR-regulated permease PerM n=1 Tax=Nitrosospira briensis TaxID=35799 RepID=A0A1I5A023_9PROT|nr:AI-2E family transporter [Nitrosospira briensis]SFN55639.1 Predicted PurR-regulated permease PerM [Nitrosospira briensis]SFO06054.1 Predicted PurR-regulated permease PerM [Nitrosospira briensis]